MFKPTGTPQPQKRYKDAHGALVTVESVSHNRVTFYRDGYQSPCVQHNLKNATKMPTEHSLLSKACLTTE